MKEVMAMAMLTVMLVFCTPCLLAQDRTASPTAPQAAEKNGETQETEDAAVTLRVWNGSKTVEMSMKEYLAGVVRGEMPASFEPQALAAQAVAERTYIYYQIAGGPKDKHPDADICMDHTCCNAWVSEEDAGARWAENADAYEAKIRQAVESTDNQVMLYKDQPILAVFHSSSAGVTADSEDVWVSDVPYLTSVKSPETADSVPNYYSVKTLTAEEFSAAFLKAHPEAKLSGAVDTWIGKVERNGSDRVETVCIGGVTVEGTEARSIFGLRSACFTVEASDEGVTFHVTGYGHGVGMSQYGANELAKQGKSWQDILNWYYTGITIAPYTK